MNDTKNSLDNYIRINKKYNELLTNINNYKIQKTENQFVLEELQTVTSSNIIYKMIGIALVKQTKEESIKNIEQRLEFLDKEIESLEESIKQIETEFKRFGNNINPAQHKLTVGDKAV